MADHSDATERRLHPSVRGLVDSRAPTRRRTDAIPSPDIVDGNRRPIPRRLLCRFDDHAVFAYARGNDLVRRSDDALWAHLCSDVVLSARSGEPLAYVVGSVLYDATTQLPAYYFVER